VERGECEPAKVVSVTLSIALAEKANAGKCTCNWHFAIIGEHIISS
jgi:hypothetical protein